jgi:cytochrome b6
VETPAQSSRILRWLDERLELGSIRHLIAKKTVPRHRYSIWYYFGGAALFLFIVQVVTGILLLLYYRPTAEAAFESVQFIMTEVTFGWLIRSIHSWSANLMIAVLFIHMFSVFLMKAYRKPRELTWVTGVILFGIALGFGFSGYLLPWNELAFFATKVGTEIVGDIPLVGKSVLTFLRGGEDVTGATLTRFFGFHVAVLPMITTALLALHLIFVQKQGMSVPPSVEQSGKHGKGMPFFPNFLLRDLLGWTLTLGVLAALAALFPWELGVKADPFAPAPPGIRPEWYFLFAFELLKLMPAKILFFEGEMIAILLFLVAGLFWLLIPFIDRRSARGERSPVFTTIGIAAVVFISVMTALAYLLPAAK